jgi:hypothetical protein
MVVDAAGSRAPNREAGEADSRCRGKLRVRATPRDVVHQAKRSKGDGDKQVMIILSQATLRVADRPNLSSG